MMGVGVRRIVLARGELDKLEGPQYAARRAELRQEAGEAARAEERGATEEEATGGRATRGTDREPRAVHRERRRGLPILIWNGDVSVCRLSRLLTMTVTVNSVPWLSGRRERRH